MIRLKICVISIVVFALAVTSIPVFGNSQKVESRDGTSIVYTVDGKILKKGDPTLFFVHCWCCNRKFWKNQLPIFAKKYQVVALDLAGHGDSGKERGKYTIEAYGQDVAAVVKELQLKNVILIGHSMGGPVSLQAAALLPGTVTGVIGVDTFQDFEFKYPQQQKDIFVGNLKKDFKGFVPMMINMMVTDATGKEVKDHVINVMSSAPPKVGIESMLALFDMDLAAAAKKAGVPVHCVNSDLHPTNVENGKKHAKSFGVKLVKGVGHFPHMSKPEEFNKALQETIDELVK